MYAEKRISRKSCTEKRSMASERECLTETAARSWLAAEQRAELACPTNFLNSVPNKQHGGTFAAVGATV